MVGVVVDYHHGQIDLDRDYDLVVIDQMVDHLAWLGNVIETYDSQIGIDFYSIMLRNKGFRR